jgi:site-specific DNA recombinase
MKRAVGYIRVSTEEQAREGVSLAAQAERIERYCQLTGLELVGVVEDAGVSGGVNRGRAGFVELLDRVEAGGVDALVVYRLDRVSRGMLTLLAFELLLNESGVEIHTAEGQVNTATPDGWLSFAMAAVMGEFERRTIAYRTKTALSYKRKNGKVTGAVPYGFRREGDNLVVAEAEQAVIRTAARLYARGNTLAEICRKLTRRGLRTRAGREFTPQQVKRALPVYEPKWSKDNQVNREIKSFLLAIA